MKIHFTPLAEKHLMLLYDWFQEPLVKRWYARGDTYSLEDLQQKYLPRIQGKESVPSFIINIEDKPSGFIQYYALSNYLPEGISDHNNPLFELAKPNSIAGIDLFIADPAKRGKGIGAKVLKNFVNQHLAKQYEYLVVDPLADNQQAIACYKKCSFEETEYSKSEQYLLLILKTNGQA